MTSPGPAAKRRGLERELHHAVLDRAPLWAHDRPCDGFGFDAPRRTWATAACAKALRPTFPAPRISPLDVQANQRIRRRRAPASSSAATSSRSIASVQRFQRRGAVTGWQCVPPFRVRTLDLRNGSEDFSFYLYGTKQFGDVEAWATYGYWTRPREQYLMPLGAAQLHRRRHWREIVCCVTSCRSRSAVSTTR